MGLIVFGKKFNEANNKYEIRFFNITKLVLWKLYGAKMMINTIKCDLMMIECNIEKTM